MDESDELEALRRVWDLSRQLTDEIANLVRQIERLTRERDEARGMLARSLAAWEAAGTPGGDLEAALRGAEVCGAQWMRDSVDSWCPGPLICAAVMHPNKCLECPRDIGEDPAEVCRQARER